MHNRQGVQQSHCSSFTSSTPHYQQMPPKHSTEITMTHLVKSNKLWTTYGLHFCNAKRGLWFVWFDWLSHHDVCFLSKGYWNLQYKLPHLQPAIHKCASLLIRFLANLLLVVLWVTEGTISHCKGTFMHNAWLFLTPSPTCLLSSIPLISVQK